MFGVSLFGYTLRCSREGRTLLIRQALTQTFGTTGDLQQPCSGGSGDHSSNSDTDAEQRLGASSALRMMESLAQKQERAYERLYHWLQKHLHLFSSSSTGPPLIPRLKCSNDKTVLCFLPG
jgi:hypothetical protein